MSIVQNLKRALGFSETDDEAELQALANADDKALKEGGVYNVGFAVHDDNITTRGHHVSFNRTLGLGAKKGTKVDINAVKLP